jgi:hypothetical protein
MAESGFPARLSWPAGLWKRPGKMTGGLPEADDEEEVVVVETVAGETIEVAEGGNQNRCRDKG